ncbi:MAG: SDR family NAD(P)-dependent oxidoreductase [Alkalimonas sp.]|nr:SDR family NAD(P)-dependent oxidoreductase [Alkalimonas sp.]
MAKVMIVGASGGIANGLMQHYLAAGWQVDALSRQPAIIEQEGLNWYQLDESNEVVLNDTLEQCFSDTVDVIFLCQGWLHDEARQPEKAIAQLKPAQLEQALTINLFSPARYLQALMPWLFRTPNIRVLVLSAKVGSITDNSLGGWYSYRISKAALNMLVKTASIELRRRNKTASLVAVHPGTTATALSAPFQARVPEQQLQQPAETAARLAKVAAALTCEQSGHLLHWDGSSLPY